MSSRQPGLNHACRTGHYCQHVTCVRHARQSTQTTYMALTLHLGIHCEAVLELQLRNFHLRNEQAHASERELLSCVSHEIAHKVEDVPCGFAFSDLLQHLQHHSMSSRPDAEQCKAVHVCVRVPHDQRAAARVAQRTHHTLTLNGSAWTVQQQHTKRTASAMSVSWPGTTSCTYFSTFAIRYFFWSSSSMRKSARSSGCASHPSTVVGMLCISCKRSMR